MSRGIIRRYQANPDACKSLHSADAYSALGRQGEPPGDSHPVNFDAFAIFDAVSRKSPGQIVAPRQSWQTRQRMTAFRTARAPATPQPAVSRSTAWARSGATRSG